MDSMDVVEKIQCPVLALNYDRNNLDNCLIYHHGDTEARSISVVK